MKTVLTVILATAWIGLSASQAAIVERTIVYIECTEGVGGKLSHGSGVIVSERGHVLTARHVVPKEAICKGSIGVADSGTARRLVVQPTIAAVDAALLQFADSEKHEFMHYCVLEDWMIRSKIFVAGFPGGTETGAASFREGVLSTTRANPRGFIETDGQTIAGMSGGPVFSKNLTGLVGIVTGAESARTGGVAYFGILPVSSIAQAFGLIQSPKPCYHRSREVDLPKMLTEWNSDKASVRLGVRAEDGVCFLSKVWGQFNATDDSVSVELQDGEYVLTGVNRSGGQHGGAARCIWYD